MILGGDEFMRTQKGNNNAYCQDNEISYFDWDMAGKNRSWLTMSGNWCLSENAIPISGWRAFYGQDRDLDTMKDINWYSVDLSPPGGIFLNNAFWLT